MFQDTAIIITITMAQTYSVTLTKFPRRLMVYNTCKTKQIIVVRGEK